MSLAGIPFDILLKSMPKINVLMCISKQKLRDDMYI